jgi:hypothetical protein
MGTLYEASNSNIERNTMKASQKLFKDLQA